MVRATFCAAATLVAAALFTGCTSSEPHPNREPSFVAQAEAALEDARNAGATDAQIAALEAARDSGEVTRSEVNDAIADSAACMQDNGLTFEWLPDALQFGVAQPDYRWGAPLDPTNGMTHEQLLALGDDCLLRNSAFLETLFMLQPSSVDQQDAWLEANVRPLLEQCLLLCGATPASGDTYWDLVRLNDDFFWQDGVPRGVTPELAAQYGPAEDCLVLALMAAGG